VSQRDDWPNRDLRWEERLALGYPSRDTLARVSIDLGDSAIRVPLPGAGTPAFILPGIDGLATLAKLRERRVDAPVVMISGHGNIESAVRAIKLGAFDFVEKPLSLEKTVLVVGNAVRQRRLEAENRALRAHVDRRLAMVGESYAMAQLREQVESRPGAVELVERLRGRTRLGLASNSPRHLVDSALSTARITDAFDAIVTSDDAAFKPAPDIYLLACERLGVSPEEALALEDSASGVAAAKAAGLTCIAVPQFAEIDVSAADRIIDSLEELLAET